MDGNEFRAELKRHGWRQVEFARRVGVWPQTVNRWAKGQREIPSVVVAYLRDVPAEA